MAYVSSAGFVMLENSPKVDVVTPGENKQILNTEQLDYIMKQEW